MFHFIKEYCSFQISCQFNSSVLFNQKRDEGEIFFIRSRDFVEKKTYLPDANKSNIL